MQLPGGQLLATARRSETTIFASRKCKSNPARISSGESPQTIRYQLERLSPDFRSVTEQLKLVTFHKVPSSSRSGRQPLRLAKSRLRRLLACIAPAGAYQAGNTGSSPVGITNQLDILEFTSSILFCTKCVYCIWDTLSDG